MNYLPTRSLKELALYILAAILLILLIEFLVMHAAFNKLEEAEAKYDYTRSAQVQNQQIAHLVQAYDAKNPTTAAEIIAKINDQQHALTIIGTGGRLQNTDIILDPLPRLANITYTELYKNWNTYKESANIVLSEEKPSVAVIQDTLATDSTQALITEEQNIKQIDRSQLTGQWLTVSTWYDRLLTDLSDLTRERRSTLRDWLIAFAILDILLFTALLLLFYRYVLTPMKQLKENVSTLQKQRDNPPNEIGELSKGINEIIEQLNDATEFVSAIGEGKLDFDYQTLDETYAAGKNRLADSLILMQGKLKSLNEEEHRRQWANEGLTKFVDILRSSDNNLSSLGDKIISALVKYTNSNQGGLYVLNAENEQNQFLELVSLFAFDIKKYEKRHVKLGEGILGQTFLEKETTLLTEIPDEYIRITSGLGDANPKSILIVPLKVDQEVHGIVELASFKNYQPHEVAFVEKLAETIASTLASVRVAQRNQHLIEQFQIKNEQMQAQEEEMRQTLEELQAIQEQMSRKEKETTRMLTEHEHYKQDIIHLLNEVPAKIFLKDSYGNMVLCNKAVADGYNLPIEKIIGTHDRDHFDPEQVKIWEAQEQEIMREGLKTFMQEEKLHGKTRYLKTTKMPFRIDHLNQNGLMGFQIDVTDSMSKTNSQPAAQRADDWELAQEVEKTLRLQLDALRITQEEVRKA